MSAKENHGKTEAAFWTKVPLVLFAPTLGSKTNINCKVRIKRLQEEKPFKLKSRSLNTTPPKYFLRKRNWSCCFFMILNELLDLCIEKQTFSILTYYHWLIAFIVCRKTLKYRLGLYFYHQKCTIQFSQTLLAYNFQ